MPKRIVPLTDIKVRTAKPTERPQKLFDGRGLFILITPTGGKLWRLKYRFEGTEKKLPPWHLPGRFPCRMPDRSEMKRVTCWERVLILAQTGRHRRRHTPKSKTRLRLSPVSGMPSFHRPGPRATPTRSFGAWNCSSSPWLGAKPIRTITAPDLLTALRRLEDKGTLDTAHRTKQNCGQVFRYAIATGRADRDPTPDLRGALPTVHKKHYAAITDPIEVEKTS
jgi:hypothetical protein